MSDPLPPLAIYHERAEEFLSELRKVLPTLRATASVDIAGLKANLPDAEVLLCRVLPPEVLPQAKRLRWIQLISAGIEGIVAARPAIDHLKISNARGIHADLMSDYALAAMTMLLWDFPGLLRAQAAKEWHRGPKRALSGRTLCVLGPGAIGGEIGRRAACAGMHVIGVRRTAGALPGFDETVTRDALDAVLPRADFVCCAVPATAETERMMGARQFALMKPGAFFLNISRGSLVDEPALIAALQRGAIAGAALDVFEQEPPAADNPLWTMPHVIMTPHVSGMLDTNTERVVGIFADNMRRYLSGEALHNAVDLNRGY
jgi:phosphoglycerate dehydrogenase-like enzyme